MRPTWKGELAIGFVTAAVAAIPATSDAARVSFNQLHRGCRARIRQKNVCSACSKDVDRADIVKGFEYEKNQYVVIEDAELTALKVESTRRIQIDQVCALEELDPLMFERSYYLVPEGNRTAQTFATFVAALDGKAAVGTIALSQRETRVAVVADGGIFLMHTLRASAEVRRVGQVVAGLALPAPNPEEVELAKLLIDRLDQDVDFSSVTDRYRDAVRELVEAKVAGREVAPVVERPKAAVADLRDALRQSLAALPKAKTKRRVKVAA